MLTLPNKLAIITGPTSGIGLSFATALARKGFQLLLIARREVKLKQLCDKLRKDYGANASYIVADLSDENDIVKVEHHLCKLERIDLLINNAGFGLAGYFMEVSLHEQLQMVNVHLTSTIRFSKAVLGTMTKQKHGYIINLASLAAFMELPGSVMYATTKAAIIKFSQTLQSEVGKDGIKIQALSPGFTPTSFHASIKRNTDFTNRVPNFLWTSADKVVETSLNSLNSGKVICVPGSVNSILFWVNKAPFISKWMQYIANKRRKAKEQELDKLFMNNTVKQQKTADLAG